MTPPSLPKTRLRKLLDAVAIGLALAFAYVVLLLGLVAALAILSPPLVEDQAFILFLSIVCAGMVIGPPVLVPTLLQRLRTLPDDSLKTTHTDDSVAPMIRSLRIRSRLFKLGAAGVFLLVVMTTLFGFPARVRVLRGAFVDGPRCLFEPRVVFGSCSGAGSSGFHREWVSRWRFFRVSSGIPVWSIERRLV